MKAIIATLLMIQTIFFAQPSFGFAGIMGDQGQPGGIKQAAEVIAGAALILGGAILPMKELDVRARYAILLLGMLALNEQTSELNFKKVSDEDAGKMGMTAAEEAAFNRNLATVNAIVEGSLHKSVEEGLEFRKSVRLMDQSLGAGLDEQTLTAVNKVRDYIIAQDKKAALAEPQP